MTNAIEGLTIGQLFHILQHLQKLTEKAPDVAHQLLRDNPMLSCALLHAQMLVGAAEDPDMLPLTPEELQKAKDMSAEIQKTCSRSRRPSAALPISSSRRRPGSALRRDTGHEPTRIRTWTATRSMGKSRKRGGSALGHSSTPMEQL